MTLRELLESLNPKMDRIEDRFSKPLNPKLGRVETVYVAPAKKKSDKKKPVLDKKYADLFSELRGRLDKVEKDINDIR